MGWGCEEGREETRDWRGGEDGQREEGWATGQVAGAQAVQTALGFNIKFQVVSTTGL